MSDTTLPPDSDTFDPTHLAPEPAPMPGDSPKPDHTASADAPTPDNVRPIGSARPFSGRRKSASDKSGKAKRDIPSKRPGQLVKPLTTLYTSMGAAVSAFDPACGIAILDNAEKCAESLDALAQRNEAVRRALYAMLETSAWGGVMAAHMPILVMLMVHHGPPDVSRKFAPIAAFTAPTAYAQAFPPDAGEGTA